jgi:hypothetical protein
MDRRISRNRVGIKSFRTGIIHFPHAIRLGK